MEANAAAVLSVAVISKLAFVVMGLVLDQVHGFDVAVRLVEKTASQGHEPAAVVGKELEQVSGIAGDQEARTGVVVDAVYLPDPEAIAVRGIAVAGPAL